MSNQNGRRTDRPMADPFGSFVRSATGGDSDNGINDMATNMMKDYAIGKVIEKYDQNKGYLSFLSLEGLKVYFDVTNSYVLHKLKIILFPFLLKEDDWKRG